MYLLLILLERLAPLLPQSVRAFAEQRLLRWIERRTSAATPRDAAFMQRLCKAAVDTAETDEEARAAIAFAHRVDNTLVARDRSGHFHPRQPRRMRVACSRECALVLSPAPAARLPRALELSG